MGKYDDGQVKIICASSLRMTELADESVQCVVTSPPYWGLRKYSGEQEMIWGGNEKCEHEWHGQGLVSDIRKDTVIAGKSRTEERFYGGDETRKFNGQHQKHHQDSYCTLCGAWRGAYGLEPTPEMYIDHTIEFLREIRRVLRKDGVVFWNIGDSYATSHAEVGTIDRETGWTSATAQIDMKDRGRTSTRGHPILKPKDLCLIPFRVAIAAQQDGWWVRSVIIWSKPNPMPESVTDRPTDSHEYILMLTKSARYYWNADAVREPLSPAGEARYDASLHFGSENKRQDDEVDSGRVGRMLRGQLYKPTGRNIRSVWEFPTQPYPEAHFAVFPEALPEKCIMAATPPKCCAECGAPWERIVEKQPSQFNIRVRDAKAGRATPEEGYKATQEEIDRYPGNHPDPGYSLTLGWHPTCSCDAGTKSSLVLDPFMGAGTALWVAKKLGRQAVGYELSEEYCDLAAKRVKQLVMPLEV